MDMDFVSHKTLHYLMVDKVYRFLSEKNDDIVNNTSSREKKYWGKLKLVTNEYIYPDIIDFRNKLVYEIHIIGERRREYFDKLPEYWKGIHVFIEDQNSVETLIVKVGEDFKVKTIKWKILILTKYDNAIKSIIPWISEQIKKDGILEVDIEDITKKIELFGEDIDNIILGFKYILFCRGFFVEQNEQKLMIRKKKEGDKLDLHSESMKQWTKYVIQWIEYDDCKNR